MGKQKSYRDRPTTKYIRNRDLKHFKKSEYGMYKGAALTKYYGTVQDANKKRVPVYNANGTLKKTSFAYGK